MRKSDILNYSIILLSVILLSCSSDREIRHSFTVEEVDGVLTAVTTGGPKYSEELFTYEKVLTLKQDPTVPESLLNEPPVFTMDQRRMFYVEDMLSRRIAVFDSTGHYSHSIGRKGTGPGEFRWVEIIDVRGDTLILHDGFQRRTTRFLCDGTLLDVFTFPLTGPLAHPGTPYSTVEGQWLLFKRPTEVEANLRFAQVKIITLTAQLDTFGVIESSQVPTHFRSNISVDGATGIISNPIPFNAWPNAEYVYGKGILVTTGEEPVLYWYKLDGTLIQKVILDLAPRLVTSQEKNAYIAEVNRQIDEATTELRRNSFIAEKEGLIFPETKSFWSGVLVDDEGFIWLRVTESPDERELAGGGRAYYVLSPEGEFLGTTRTPANGQVVQGNFLAIMTDPETEEQVPTVWRLVPQAEGFIYP